MRFALLIFLPLASLVIGCSPPGAVLLSAAPTLPEAKDVKRVRLQPNRNLVPGKLPAFDYTERAKIEKVLEWLRRVDWSKEPGDITRMDLPPFSPLELFLNDGSTLRFSLTGQAIIYKERLWPADVDELIALARKLGG